MTDSSTKISIWVLAKYATAREQGFETRSVALAREWVRSGRRVVIISSSANHILGASRQHLRRVDHIFDGVRILVLRTLTYSRTASIRRVLSWLHFEWRVLREALDDLPRPDVIIVTSLSLFSVLNGIRLARKHQCPWVFEVRDIWPLTLTEEGRMSPWHPLSRVMGWIERLGYRRANLTVGTMPNLSPHASRIARRDVHCACVPFGFDPAQSRTLDAFEPHPKVRISRNGAELIVGYAGSIGTANALDSLIATAVALRNDPRFLFVFLGDGDLRPTLEASTRGLPNVVWLGKVRRAEVHGVLRQCDLLYFATRPSKVWQSGMSLNKVTDYLLAAKPIVASYSGHPSILDESGCGEFVPADDTSALMDCLDRFAQKLPKEREEMGEAGRRWLFANRTWKLLADDYLALLDALPIQEKP